MKSKKEIELEEILYRIDIINEKLESSDLSETEKEKLMNKLYKLEGYLY